MTKKIVPAAKGWLPKKGAKINGVPERLGFSVVVIIAALIILFAVVHG